MRRLAMMTLPMALTLAACGEDTPRGEPIAAAEVQPLASAHAEAHTDAAARLMSRLETLADERAGWMIEGLMEGLAEGGCALEEDGFTECEPVSPGEAMVDLKAGLEELVSTLLDDALIEHDGERVVIYRLEPAFLCGLDLDEVGGPAGAGEADPECMDLFGRLPVRIRATAPEVGDLNLALEIGEGRHAPVGLRLHRDRLGAWINLGALIPSVRAVAEAAGERMPEMPFSLEGRVEAWMSADDQSLRLGLEAPRGLSLSGTVENRVVSLSLEPSRVEGALLVNDAALSLTLEVDVGRALMSLPAELVSGDEFACEIVDNEQRCEPVQAIEGVFTGRFGGLSGRLEADLLGDRLSIQELSLGNTPLKLSLNGDTLLEMDLNDTLGGLLNAEVELEADEAGAPVADVTLSPGLDFYVEMRPEALSPLVDIEGDPLWARVEIKGADQPHLRVYDTEAGGVIEMVEGQLSVSASEGEPLVVEAGQCLLGPVSEAEDAAPQVMACGG